LRRVSSSINRVARFRGTESFHGRTLLPKESLMSFALHYRVTQGGHRKVPFERSRFANRTAVTKKHSGDLHPNSSYWVAPPGQSRAVNSRRPPTSVDVRRFFCNLIKEKRNGNCKKGYGQEGG
jgi:hypothetical protein